MQILATGSRPAVRQAAEVLTAAGSEVVMVETAAEAAARLELGDVTVVLLGPGPEEVAAFARLDPRARRRTLLVQLSSEVTTADGTAAFMRGVNLVVAEREAPRVAEVLNLALRRHRELVGLVEPELIR